jgi:hypothetical protein
MPLLEGLRESYRHADERVAAFCDKHNKAIVYGEAAIGAGAVALGAFTGNVAATTGGASTYYGLSVVDWAFIALGGIALMGGLIMREFRVLLIGALMVGLGGVAFYLGV